MVTAHNAPACTTSHSACFCALRVAVHADALWSRWMLGRVEGSSRAMLATARPSCYGSSSSLQCASYLYFALVTYVYLFLAHHEHAISMLWLCYKHDVCLSLCFNIGGLWSHNSVKSGNGYKMGLCLGYLHANTNPDHNILWSRIPLMWCRKMWNFAIWCHPVT